MNQENLNYLKENLKFTGFADKLNLLLEAAIKKQEPEFTLKLETEVNMQPVNAELYFKKSTETDMYFFNKYGVQVKNEKEGKEMVQTFYINQGHGVTLKEAFNLLSGRAVHKELENKEGEKYKAWIKLDFSEKDAQGNFRRQQFHENYGYNLVEALSKFPIRELTDEKQKEEFVRSLEKGNLQVATFEKNGKTEKLYLEANPQFKSVSVYDMKMNRIQSQDMNERWGQSMNGREHAKKQDTKKESAKQSSGDEEAPGAASKQSKKKSRRKGQSVS
jgi:hypothetical protein